MIRFLCFVVTLSIVSLAGEQLGPVGQVLLQGAVVAIFFVPTVQSWFTQRNRNKENNKRFEKEL